MADLKCASCAMPLTGEGDVKCAACKTDMKCDEAECKCEKCGNAVKTGDVKCVHCLGIV